jgi:hypothetical protein
MVQRMIPDARWINRALDIRLVAHALGIQGRTDDRFHCWNPQNHRNGDADPSVRYWKAGNRLRCFVCDRRAVGVIDLVMEVQNTDFNSAVGWIAGQFAVQEIPARKRQERAERRRLDGITHPIDYLIRSHIFSRLSAPTQAIAPTLAAFSDKPEGISDSPRTLTISYAALVRYSGLRSPNAVSKALRELEIIGWLQIKGSGRGPLRSTAVYNLTPFAESVVNLGHALAEEEQMEIAYERGVAKVRKADREKAFRERTAARIPRDTKLPLSVE